MVKKDKKAEILKATFDLFVSAGLNDAQTSDLPFGKL